MRWKQHSDVPMHVHRSCRRGSWDLRKALDERASKFHTVVVQLCHFFGVAYALLMCHAFPQEVQNSILDLSVRLGEAADEHALKLNIATAQLCISWGGLRTSDVLMHTYRSCRTASWT